ncbi:MAG: proline racemase family protein [Desulfobacterales bacterium]|nr:proline racemase family protein [Desulfobacterales bacterium]
MLSFKDAVSLVQTSTDPVVTIDSHTEGEITRLIVGGLAPIPGRTMDEKRRYFKTHYDGVRCRITKEPRGSRDILAAMVTEAVTPEASFGLIYMDARRYPLLCGHATMGAVVTLAATGTLELNEGKNSLGVDTPSGTMGVMAWVEKGKVISVAIDMVPSFVESEQCPIEVPGFGRVWVDLVCTGGYFAMVDSHGLGIAPTLENRETLVDLGMKIIDAANAQLSVAHPLRPEVNTIDVTEFYTSASNPGDHSGSGFVVYGESHMDRSPCGTGTASKLALLAHHGKLNLNQPYRNHSPLGTAFDARLVEKTQVGPKTAWVTQIRGRAWITGIHQFILDPSDPFPQGYLV